MSPAACPRLFEAEAMRDDRLGAVERASLERHVAACAVCSREVQALELLAEPLRVNSRSATDADELHVRRERMRLLAAFDRTLVAPERGQGARRRWIAVPAVAAALIAGVVFWRMQPSARPAHTSNAVVHADSTAVWSRRIAADREQVVLERGALFIRVEHLTVTKTQFVVLLPDGELEDIGTTFTVSAQDGRTTHVTVQEGSVVLRLRGLPPLAIGAGDTWTRDARPPAQACPPNAAPPVTPAPQHASPSRAASPAATTQSGSSISRSCPAPSRRTAARHVAEQPDPAADFRAAIGVLERGKSAEAAAAFARFYAKYPRDPRAEDAAYLRVIALHKQAGADGDMKRAAQQYLSRFPTGLRRVEIEKVSSGL